VAYCEPALCGKASRTSCCWAVTAISIQ